MNCLERTTLQYLRSVNDPDYPLVDYLPIAPGSPEQTLIDTVPRQYLKLTGDVLSEMTQGEKDAVDAAQAAALVSDNRVEAVDVADANDGTGFHVRALIELLNKRDNYLTNRIEELQAALDAMKASTGNIAALRDSIPATWLPTNTRPRPDAVQDYKDSITTGGVDT